MAANGINAVDSVESIPAMNNGHFIPHCEKDIVHGIVASVIPNAIAPLIKEISDGV